MGDGIAHFSAHQVNPLWLGWKITARNRADGQTVTGGLSDFERFTDPAEVRLYMGGRTVELRDADTVTAGGLDVLGGAA